MKTNFYFFLPAALPFVITSMLGYALAKLDISTFNLWFFLSLAYPLTIAFYINMAYNLTPKYTDKDKEE